MTIGTRPWWVKARRERDSKNSATLVADGVGATRIEPCRGLDVLRTNLIDLAIAAHPGGDAEYLTIDATIVHAHQYSAGACIQARGERLFRRSGCPWDSPPTASFIRQT
jgi:hypothetical protein